MIAILEWLRFLIGWQLIRVSGACLKVCRWEGRMLRLSLMRPVLAVSSGCCWLARRLLPPRPETDPLACDKPAR
jgi:hypothetical protein